LIIDSFSRNGKGGGFVLIKTQKAALKCSFKAACENFAEITELSV